MPLGGSLHAGLGECPTAKEKTTKKKLSPENSLHSALHVQNLSAVMRSGEKFPTSESRHGE